jgi:hypothetical protein
MDDKSLEPPPAKDDDPSGSKLLSAPDPLERAAKVLQPLGTLVPDRIDVWIAIFDVAVRRSTRTRLLLSSVRPLTCQFLLREVPSSGKGPEPRSLFRCCAS